jgi:hypothetical protein
MPMTREEGVAKMMAAARRRPLLQLGEALELLDAKPKPDDAERLTRAVLMDVICERCPEAEAAFTAWADSDNCDVTVPVAAIVAAAKAAGR